MKKILITLLVLFLVQPLLAQWKSLGEFKGQTTYYQKMVVGNDFQRSVQIKKEGVKRTLLFDCSTPRIKYTYSDWIPVKFKIDYGTWLWANVCSLPTS